MTFKENIVLIDTIAKALEGAGYSDIRMACDSSTYYSITKRQTFFCIAAWKGEQYYLYANAVCRTGENSKCTSVTLIPAMDLSANVDTHAKKVHIDSIEDFVKDPKALIDIL